MRLLLIEDDAMIREAVCKGLRQDGFTVDWVADGAAGEIALQHDVYDLVLLDLGLPRKDGLSVLKSLRRQGNRVPVLILTARDAVESRVQGLDLGADDYMTKPFDLAELEARVRALIRRGQLGSNAALTCAGLSLDPASRRAYCAERPLELSARELGVLEILLLRQHKVVAKEQILTALCSWDEDIGDNAIEVYIHRLRKKLEGSGARIRTIRGLGYLLEHD